MVVLLITYLMCTLVLLLTISLQLVASYSICLPSLYVFTTLLPLTDYICNLQKPCQGNFGKFPWLGEVRFGSSEKDQFLKIPKWQHKLVWGYKRGKLVSYFLSNAAQTCLYGITSENIVLSMPFSLKHFFFISAAIFTQFVSVPLNFTSTK